MKTEAENNNSIVLTLNSDISSQLLGSKKEEKHKTDSSSIELWIKSLKDIGDLTDDYRSDHDNTDSCSDQDDLQLGAEATNLLRKRQKAQKNGGLSSDSDDSKYSPRRSRHYFLIKRNASQTSLDSDASGLSSVTSVSSLLTARESDPEEVLKGLGFGGPNVLDNIPDRFITAGTRCQGINANEFVSILKRDSMDSTCDDSDLPPWVMARVDDIPKQFLQSNNSTFPHTPEYLIPPSNPLVNEPTLNADGVNVADPGGNHSRPPKTLPFPSKFGTFLEPVSEEVELSSQGSINGHSPVTIKNVSFESNRSSTLKANSHDEPSESLIKIPSLKDLWETQTSETDFNSRDESGSFEMLTDDVVAYTPGLNTPGYFMDEEQRPEGVSEVRGDIQGPEGRGLDGISRVTDVDHGLDEVPGIFDGPWNTPVGDQLSPTVLDYLAVGEMPIAEEDPVSSDHEVKKTTQLSEKISGNHSLTLGQDSKDVKEIICANDTSLAVKISPSPQAGVVKNALPIVTITSPDQTHNMPTVLLPDVNSNATGKLDIPEDNDGNPTGSQKSVGKEELGSKMVPKKTLQLNLYEKWVVSEKAAHPQIHISNKPRQKITSLQNIRTKQVKVIVTKRTHFPTQIVLPQIHSQNIECFMNLGAAFASTDQVLERTSSVAPSVCYSEDSSGFVSLATNSNYSTPTDEVNLKTSDSVAHQKGLDKKDQGDKLDTESWCKNSGEKLSVSCEEYYSKADSVNFCANLTARTDYDKLLKNEVSIEEDLDGLQSSLKGVKLYKAGIHLMQLASSIEHFNSPEPQHVQHAIKSSQSLLLPIQNELRHLEEHILYLQKQLTELQEQRINGERLRRESDFSNVTRQLLHEQLKVFNSISNSVSPSPSSTPSCEEALPPFSTEDPGLRNDVRKLRIEIQRLRQENDGRHSLAKNEILSEVRTEIKNCFSEFLENFEKKM